jgi:hypothetical protein
MQASLWTQRDPRKDRRDLTALETSGSSTASSKAKNGQDETTQSTARVDTVTSCGEWDADVAYGVEKALLV